MERNFKSLGGTFANYSMIQRKKPAMQLWLLLLRLKLLILTVVVIADSCSYQANQQNGIAIDSFNEFL